MPSDQIIVAGVLWLLIGIGVATAAVLAGRPFLPWLLYGVAFWPLALFHLVFWRQRMRGGSPLDEDET